MSDTESRGDGLVGDGAGGQDAAVTVTNLLADAVADLVADIPPDSSSSDSFPVVIVVVAVVAALLIAYAVFRRRRVRD